MNLPTSDQLTTPRMLILNSGDPTHSGGVGEQFLNNMLRGYPRNHLVRVALSESSSRERGDWLGTPCHLLPTKNSAMPVWSSWLDRRFERTDAKPFAETIRQVATDFRAELIWVFLNSTQVIHLTSELQTRFNVPYVAAIWDTPEYLCFKSRLDPIASRRILAKFAHLLKKAAGIVTISPQMTEIYQQRYGVASSPMTFCSPRETWQPVSEPEPHGPIRVVFAGSLYAWREWNAFLDAVALRNQQHDQRPIEVTCIGPTSRWAKKRDWVIYEPLKPATEAAQIINRSHLAYLPYWMDRRHAFFAQTAFPSKLPFYVAAGTPVFFHGPHDSTPTHFIQDHPVGVCCHSTRTGPILEALDRATCPDFRQQFVTVRQHVLNKTFHPDRCTQIFHQTLEQVFATQNEPNSSGFSPVPPRNN